ncbi:transcription factor MYC1 isoform X2 [Manihot esculenta]|uniref:transcription factor MYC1 isoform X2 n=1 Tax=Manihot esculenta TaxID=3983 RepID=UPI001CC78A12|nr:transcription factor MYC1 isoform X2 [Manihot esculenta]
MIFSRVLEWVDGYYNGDIKTRKTVQALELKHDEIGLQRSEQLRELYTSLLECETDQQAKRPSAALSPEDLSDAEWYYLLCMSFLFSPGQSLPGRALENRETIWLCNAQYADNKVFSRSLLAKSASIQTVVCFPHLGGVAELGVTELVAEDPSLIQHIKASLLEFSKPVCAAKSLSAPHSADDDKGPVCVQVDCETVYASEDLHHPADTQGNGQQELNMDSADDCSNGFEKNHRAEDSILEYINGGTSHVQSWHFTDGELSNGAEGSVTSSDCMSEAVANEGNSLSCPKDKNISHFQLKELQEGNNRKFSSLDLGASDNLHYRRTLSLVLRSSTQLSGNSCFCSGNHKSNFFTWKKGAFNGHKPQLQQNMLKKILFTIPLMHSGSSLRPHIEDGGEDSFRKLKSNEICQGLKLMIHSVSEMNKASIVNDMIKYLQELEARVEELESCMDLAEYTAGPRRNDLDMVEQTSDNYENKNTDNEKKLWTSKRKASDIYETVTELDEMVSDQDVPSNVKVSMREKEVEVEMKCSYREYILLDIMDEINNLHLDVHSVQSSTIDGILTVTLKSKFRGAAVAPAGMIKQALLKIGCN